MKMNERKIRNLFILLISIITLSISNVYAYNENAQAGVTTNGTENCDITYDGQCHKDYNIEVKWNGKSYTGYCADFNGHLGGLYNDQENHSYQCTEMNDATLGYILGSSLPYSVKEAALRAVKHPNYSIEGSLAGDIQNLVQNAMNGTTGSLTFTQASASGATVTYNVTSNAPLTNVDFTCDSNCTMGNKIWNGTSGSVTVTATKGCSFTITATYDGAAGVAGAQSSRVLKCEWNKKQTLYVALDEGSTGGSSSGNSSTTGKVSQKFTGSITSGSYYEQYCKDKDNDNDKCTEKTQVSIPNYCDISGNKITITAPKNVQYCILNGKDDAQNTYKMDDGQIKNDNPYCAVFCKEDYVMELPGAKFTDSGRYFELENTKVTATRTCYATNPKGNSDEPQIDIDQFITDVKTKQEQLINAFNEYQKANAMLESVKDIQRHDTSQGSCNGSGSCSGPVVNGVCSGNYTPGCHSTYTNDAHYGSTKNYKVATLVVKNVKEGSYTVKLNDASLSDNYGVKYSCGSGCSTTKSLVGTYRTIGEYESNRNAKLAALHEAQNELAKTIEFMEKCYNWVNNLCLNPEVLFDYNEQYSSDINYTLVSGGGDFKGTDAKYIDQKTLSNNQYVATTSDSTLEKVEYAYCDETTCNNKFERGIAEKISTLVKHYYYRSIEVKGTAEYANIQKFQTNYPHGTIDTIPEGAEIHKNYSYLGEVFPVALNTKTGVYQWTLNFSNLGMYNDEPSCKNGRLDDVVNVVTGGSASAGIDYVCVYVVDCDDCTYDCVGDYCEYDDEEEKCPECDVYCTNCIFDGDGFTYNYEVVSVNDINPNERTMGSNWTSEKGQKVLASIEDAAETVYEQPQYVITLNPNNMKEIRDYNKETDTYVAQDLDYHTKNDIQNAYGTSSFLRDEKNQRKFFKEIKLNNDWELWTSVDKTNHVGPAFK